MKSKDGFALILAIFIILFVSLLFVAVFNLLTTDLQIAGNHQRDAEALYIADAGVEYAVYNLRQDKDWSVTSEETVFPTGSGSKYIVTHPMDSDIISSVAVLSDGYSKTIEAEISVSGINPPYKVVLKAWKEM